MQLMVEFFCDGCDFTYAVHPTPVMPGNTDCYVYCEACGEPATVRGDPKSLAFTCRACAKTTFRWLRRDGCPNCRGKIDSRTVMPAQVKKAPKVAPPPEPPLPPLPADTGVAYRLGLRGPVDGPAPSLATLRKHLEGRGFKIEGARAERPDADTRVPVAFFLHDAPPDRLPLTLEVPYFRNIAFGLAADREIDGLVDRYKVRAIDTHPQGMGDGPYVSAQFYRAYDHGKREAYRAALPSRAQASLRTLPRSTIDALWRWNVRRASMQSGFGENVFVPKVSVLARPNGRLGASTGIIWSGQSVVLPNVDVVIAMVGTGPRTIPMTEILPFLKGAPPSPAGTKHDGVEVAAAMEHWALRIVPPELVAALPSLGVAGGASIVDMAEVLEAELVGEILGVVADAPAEIAKRTQETRALYEAGKLDEAIAIARGCEKLAREQLGDGDRLYYASLANLGELVRLAGRYAEAEPMLSVALEGASRLYAPNDPDRARVVVSLATLYFDVGKLAQAEPLFQESLALRRAIAPGSADVAESLNSLGLVQQRLGRAPMAEPLLREAIDIYRRLGQERTRGHARAVHNLGVLYGQGGQYAHAESLLRQALDLRRGLFGDANVETIESMASLGTFYFVTRQLQHAHPLFAGALDLTMRVLGDAHPLTAERCMDLALCFKHQQTLDAARAALPLLARAYDIRRARLGDAHPSTRSSLDELTAVKRALGVS